MGLMKWIFGALGWVAGGILGGLFGFALGAAVDGDLKAANPYKKKLGDAPGTDSARRTYSAQEQRNSFFLSLLALSSAVIRADGKVHPAELSTVKEFVRKNFGEQAALESDTYLQRLNSKQVNIYEVGPEIARNMNYSQRLQLFHYLVQIAVADGQFDASEKSVLEAIAGAIGLAATDAASVIAMFYKDTASAYSVLGIERSATDDEVRTAYRRMAMKNHPDKVATLGPEVQKAAEEKFRGIQEAYEAIKKERGMN